MAGTSLLALLDDVATLLDDVAVLTKVAGKKTAGVLGDDLALNAEQVTGVRAERELPVVWAVAKGSALNKLILVPAALAISAFIPWAVTPLLMLGGGFLCYEGFEKVAHRFLHSKEEDQQQHAQLVQAASQSAEELMAFEKDKIKGAIRTDFILSAEIIAITLGAAAEATLLVQFAVLTTIAAIITIGVYGLVAGIVKLDDVGFHLQDKGGFQAKIGRVILYVAPRFMKLLSIAGTAAMFLVGGGILAHGMAPFEHFVSQLVSGLAAQAGALGGVVSALAPSVANGLLGLIAGAVILLVVSGAKRVLRPSTA